MSDVVSKNQKNWDEYSNAYLRFKHADKIISGIVNDPSWAFEKGTWKQIQKHMGDLQGKKICVPSSGDNYAVFAFALMGADVTSCDISREQLFAGEQMAEKLGLKIRYVFIGSEIHGLWMGYYKTIV